jgi:lysozyme
MVNDRLVNSIKEHEGFEPQFYRDSLGFWTIGYGTRLTEVEIDKKLAAEWLLRELEEKRERLAYVQGFSLLSEVRQDVLLEMA